MVVSSSQLSQELYDRLQKEQVKILGYKQKFSFMNRMYLFRLENPKLCSKDLIIYSTSPPSF